MSFVSCLIRPHQSPPAPLALPERSIYKPYGWQEIKAQINTYSVLKFAVCLTVLFCFTGILFFVLDSQIDWAISSIIASGFIGWLIVAVISNPQILLPKVLIKEKKELEKNHQQLIENYGNQNATQLFRSNFEELQKKKDEYQNLGLFRAQRVQKLQEQARERQEEEYLSRYRIANASISNIGYSRTLTLGTFGIETAAHLSWQSIYRVPGFGASLASNLMGWREAIKSNFVFDQTSAITKSDEHALEGEIYRKKIGLEKELKNGLKILQNVSSQAEATDSRIYQAVQKNQEKLITFENKFSPTINKWLKILATIYLIILSISATIVAFNQKSQLKQETASTTNKSSNENQSKSAVNQLANLNSQTISDENSNLQQNTQENTNIQDSESVVNYKQGVSYTRAGKFEQAIESYQKAIELNSQFAEAYHELGYALFKMGKYKESLEASIEATKLKPKNADTYRNLGETYKALNQIDNACISFTKARDLVPKHFQTVSKLANCFVQQGDLNSATKTYSDSIKIQPNNAVAHFELGKLYVSLGRSEDAMDEYSKLLTLNKSLADKLLKEIEP